MNMFDRKTQKDLDVELRVEIRLLVTEITNAVGDGLHEFFTCLDVKEWLEKDKNSLKNRGKHGAIFPFMMPIFYNEEDDKRAEELFKKDTSGTSSEAREIFGDNTIDKDTYEAIKTAENPSEGYAVGIVKELFEKAKRDTTCDEETIEAIFRVNTKLLFETKAFIEKIQEAIEQGDLDESFTCRDVKTWVKKMNIAQDDGTPYTERIIDSILITDSDSLSAIDIESVKKYIEEGSNEEKDVTNGDALVGEVGGVITGGG